ncbi:MAG: 3'(2'),5'-bisphosphate nucleotidase CysQ [Myxococcales bacterium]|nr:3'(2'),5'-bisphosphate nucleotidase CysQ [Myxococcales bacterium]
MDLRRELAVAERLGREAAAIIAAYFGTGIKVDYKPGEGPVTQADREADALIVGGLRAAFPGDGILSEEAPDDGSRRTHERVWMVDPLDGTSDFVRERAGFAVMIGLAIAGRPVVGVVLQPTTGVLYRAVRGEGAEQVDGAGGVTRLQVSTVDELAAIRLVASKSHRGPSIDRVRAALGVTDEMNIGSVGLKLGLIARGERDLYVNPESHASLWDTLAPEVILDEAGGRMSDLAGAPIDYLGPSLKHARGLCASNGRLHDRVLSSLAPLFPPRA